MKLFNCANCVKIVLKNNASEAVRLATMDLQRNLQRLSQAGNQFPIVEDTSDATAIFIQTKSSGEPESYKVCVDDEKVVITGSDILGTIYGIYAFATKCLHIMPTYRMTDVFPEKRENLELEPQIFKSKKRQVRFRGWFINDEDLLSDFKISGRKRYIDYPYYQNVMATDVLDMVLETALRLEINLIIPASFLNIDNPDEEILAETVCRRGLYISQHHVEPMGVSYFAADDYVKKYGKEGETVSFITNRSRMEEMWRHYAKKWAKYGKQVVWQLGLRGKADQAVWKADPSAPISMEGRGQIISDAIQTQYEIVKEVLGHNEFYSTSTLWDEGSELYGKGYLKLPHNTIAIFADFGTDQMMGEDLYNTPCKEDEKYGIYYHVAFWLLGPHLTEGCRPEKMAYNYRNAAEQGKLFYSILNVSNVRPLHFSVTMNAKILEDPVGISIEKEMQNFDGALFRDAGERVNELRRAYYECFADFTEEAIIRKSKINHFYYRAYENLPFLRNAATDGQVTWYGRKTLSGKVYTDRPNAKMDIPELKKSAKKFEALYKKMVEIEKELPKESVTYFRQFLKYQTLHMFLITEWAIACEALVDEELPWKERKAKGEFGVDCLKRLLEARKVLEEGEWKNWHRGDKKLNFPMCLERMSNYILAHEKEV